MKIGIIGAGHIGKSLVQKLSIAGHEVKVANSRGPDSIDTDILSCGGRAVTTAEALADVNVVILSIQLSRIPELAPLIATVPAETVVIDTSNYYPLRDGRIDAIESGQVESLWVSEQLGRPIVKAWNAIGAGSLANKGKPPGNPERIAIPVAANNDRELAIALALVEDTGFDAVASGPLSESWRQQPGAPAYCTDLSRKEISAALTSAEPDRLPKRRDLSVAAIMERLSDGKDLDPEWGVRLVRVLFM